MHITYAWNFSFRVFKTLRVQYTCCIYIDCVCSVLAKLLNDCKCVMKYMMRMKMRTCIQCIVWFKIFLFTRNFSFSIKLNVEVSWVYNWEHVGMHHYYFQFPVHLFCNVFLTWFYIARWIFNCVGVLKRVNKTCIHIIVSQNSER